jgi:hypothetical protein
MNGQAAAPAVSLQTAPGASGDADEQEKLDVSGISGSAEELVDNAHRHIVETGNKYYHHGRVHGKPKSRNFEISGTARTHATMIADRIKSTVEGNIAMLDVAIPRLEAEVAARESIHNWCRKAWHDIIRLKNDESRMFSRFNAWFCLCCGFVIILADIAVSVNLVAYFGIGNVKPHAHFMDKVKDIELMLFSAGVALCTVYLKLFFDEYIGSKLGYLQQQFSALAEEKGIDKKQVLAEYIAKFIIKLSILGFLIWMLWNMALYRTQFTVYGKERDQLEFLGQDGGPSLKYLAGIIQNSFIGVTVILPVISGIAISVGLKIMSNRRMEKRMAAKIEEAELSYTRREKDLLERTITREQLRRFSQEWADGDKKIGLMTTYFSQQYNQGYKVGYQRAHGDDFYPLIEIARNHSISALFDEPGAFDPGEPINPFKWQAKGASSADDQNQETNKPNNENENPKD